MGGARGDMMQKAQKFDGAMKVCFMREVREINHDMKWPKKPIFAIFCIPAGIANDFSSKLMKLLQIRFSLIFRKGSGTSEDTCTAGTKPRRC